jgi:hypothetical protein
MSEPTGTPAVLTAARTVAAWQTAFNVVFLALFILMSLAAWQIS